MTRKSFVAEGWELLHDAIMRSGAELDYFPTDESELGARRYVSPDLYLDLAAPLVELANVDIKKFGNRAELVKRAIWRWIRKTAQSEAHEYWKVLLVSRNKSSTLAKFSEVLNTGRFPGAPKYEPSNPVSALRYGHWLIQEKTKSDQHPIIPVIWGLAIIGVTWSGKSKRGFCEFCYRHAYPGRRFCHFHRQSVAENDRSKAYARYRTGRLATVLDKERNGKIRSFSKSSFMDYETRKQSLANILFPMLPIDGWETERKELVDALKNAPRVLQKIGGSACLELPYEVLVDNLRQAIDPYKLDDFMWWATVFEAEKWFVLEEIVSPGKRGRGSATKALVAMAIDLANNG